MDKKQYQMNLRTMSNAEHQQMENDVNRMKTVRSNGWKTNTIGSKELEDDGYGIMAVNTNH